ncbi:MAG: hypothetical protein RLY86_727 [Pseudomonadota bacterium]|jgi:hypothetical protein
MLKVVLTILIPLLLPTLVYLAYVVLTLRHRPAPVAPAPDVGGAGGGEAVATAARPGLLAGAPWFWLIGSGVTLSAMVLVAVAVLGGQPRDSIYIPAHRLPDGSYAPARTIPRDQAPEPGTVEAEGGRRVN